MYSNILILINKNYYFITHLKHSSFRFVYLYVDGFFSVGHYGLPTENQRWVSVPSIAWGGYPFSMGTLNVTVGKYQFLRGSVAKG